MKLTVLLDIATAPIATDNVGRQVGQDGSLLWVGIVAVVLVASAVVTLILVTRRRRSDNLNASPMNGGKQ